MSFNYQLIFKYILHQTKKIFLKNKELKKNNVYVLVNSNKLYFLTLHIKLSTFFYSSQLSEIFSYENCLSFNTNNDKKLLNSVNNVITVYNFHNIKINYRFFIFIINKNKLFLKKKTKNNNYLTSISELFSNANWLERENAELSGVFFYGKKDIRNLMLQYGDTSTPFKKSYPSIGTKEIFYDSISDSLVQQQTSIQF